jgi:hypothetical protein
MKIVSGWCENAGLRLAKDKTDIMMVTGMRVSRTVKLKLGEMETHMLEATKHLGVIIDGKRIFDKHIVCVIKRTL